MRQPRWVLFGLFAVALATLCVFAGRWQWHRWHDRLDRNAAVEAAQQRDPLALADVMVVGTPLADDAEFSLVRATGAYDVAGQVLVRNHNGRGGFEVITPLVTPEGPAVLVDRGWLPQSTVSASAEPTVPDPPTGTVEVVLRLRPAEARADNADEAPPGQAYSIDVATFAGQLSYPVYGGFGELVEQEPAGPAGLERPEPPPTGSGPHFFYALQWWFFAALALVGFVLLARRESRTNDDPAAPVESSVRAGPNPEH